MRTISRRFARGRMAVLAASVVGLFAVLAGPAPMAAQSTDMSNSAGTEYVIAFPDTTTNTYDPRFPSRMADQFYIYVYSAVNTTVAIAGPGYADTLHTVGGKVSAVNLTDVNHRPAGVVTTSSGLISNSAFHLTADDPVIVYCYMATKFGAEAWTPLAVEYWGTEYHAAMLPGDGVANESPAGEFNYNVSDGAAPSEILITAAFDGTNVTITPNGSLATGTTTSVTLNAGQVYQVQSLQQLIPGNRPDTTITVDSTGHLDTLIQSGSPDTLRADPIDLAGTRITSDMPIGVISGNTRALGYNPNPGLTRNTSKNMMIEALAPVDQQGTEFAYLPTWDANRITGLPGETPTSKRQGEIVGIYGSVDGTGGTYISNATGGTTGFSVDNDSVSSLLFTGAPYARRITTDQAAQVMMASSGVIKFNGTTGAGSQIGAQYTNWGGSMVEVTPRQQWVSFAPIIIPAQPTTMNHYLNLVTDSASKNSVAITDGSGTSMNFIFNRPIPGTDLIWGSMSLASGTEHTIAGSSDDVKFYGFVYGSYQGSESYRPGSARKKDDGDGKGGNSVASSGGSQNQVLHPSEYEEYLGVAYSYPIAPSRRVLADNDGLRIEQSTDGGSLSVSVRSKDDHPSGLRKVELQRSAVNARLLLINPKRSRDILGLKRVDFQVVPIDPASEASGNVVITDRTGGTWRIPYHYDAGSSSVSTPTGAGDYALRSNPNPFHGSTSIEFVLPQRDFTTLDVYNAIGEKITTLVAGEMGAGEHTVLWNAGNAPAGLYYYRLMSGGQSRTGMMVVR